MSKKDIINYVAQATELSKKDAAIAVDAVFEGVKVSLAKGEDVSIIGFGKFEVRERSARKGRNPQTGEAMDIAASKTVGFKVGKLLKDAVK